MTYKKQIEAMQHNLVHIRKIVKITGKELGDMIGVTKQTVSNIENGRNKLTQTMYLAILYVLEKDIFPTCGKQEIDIVYKLLDEKASLCYEKLLLFENES